jgi:hypothetical protein
VLCAESLPCPESPHLEPQVQSALYAGVNMCRRWVLLQIRWAHMPPTSTVLP